MRPTPRMLKEQFEKASLSPFAMPSAESRGRMLPEKPCAVRTIYERDTGRILYSMDFRRLRQKTQVFFSTHNDHVCTRMEHVLYVKYIAGTIGKALGLNEDLIEAIALGHDLGHAPFGHAGERALNDALERSNAGFCFQHELHSLRVIDLLALHNQKRGLNLAFETRDGIACHCGERYDEFVLVPDRNKKESDLIPGAMVHDPPATLEGCVVRMADKIAYVGRDIEDANRAGLMDFEDIPVQIRTELGRTNGEIIDTLVSDIIKNSHNQDQIAMSPEIGRSLERLLEENVQRIYRSEKVRRFERLATNIVEGLFEALIIAGEDVERLAVSDDHLRSFGAYLEAHPEPDANLLRKVTDYIAGMSDHYATSFFDSLYSI